MKYVKFVGDFGSRGDKLDGYFKLVKNLNGRGSVFVFEYNPSLMSKWVSRGPMPAIDVLQGILNLINREMEDAISG